MPHHNELIDFFPVPINFFTISPDTTKQTLDVILSEMKTVCKDKKAADNVISFCKTLIAVYRIKIWNINLDTGLTNYLSSRTPKI